MKMFKVVTKCATRIRSIINLTDLFIYENTLLKACVPWFLVFSSSFINTVL